MAIEFLQSMSSEATLALIGLGLAAAAILLLKFGKRLATFVLVLLGAGAVLAVALALAGQSAANAQMARATIQATRGQTIGNIAVTILAVLLAISVAGNGYLYLRVRFLERHQGLTRRKGTARRRVRQPSSQPPAIYVIEEEAEAESTDLGFLQQIDLTQWGF